MSELLAETPVISISNSNFNEPCAYNGTRYVCDFLIDDHDFDDGVHILQIEAKDQKENSTFWSENIILDFTPPQLSVGFSPAEITATTSRSILTISADEALMAAGPEARIGAAPELIWADAAPSFSFVFSPNSSTWYFTFSAADVDNWAAGGIFSLNGVLVSDALGNEVQWAPSDLPPTLSVDMIPPLVENVFVPQPRVSLNPGYDQLEVYFDVSESVVPPIVTVANETLSCISELNGYDFYCTLFLSADVHEYLGEAEAPQLEIAISDIYGNQSFDSTPVVFDFTPPKIEQLAFSPASERRAACVPQYCGG